MLEIKRIKYDTILERIKESHCPVCESLNIMGNQNGSELYENYYSLDCSCHECESEWKEFYILTGVYIDQTVDCEVEIEDDLSNVENIPGLLKALLSQKKMLPVFMGIDSVFDEIIHKRLKE